MNNVKMELNEIPVLQGAFLAGNTRRDKEGWEIEYPVHEVTLSYDFSVQAVPVTFREYENYCRDQDMPPPSDFCPKAGYALGRGEKPVVNISWWDAIAYCNWLSLKMELPVSYRMKDQVNPGCLVDGKNHLTDDVTETKGYRLLTEAEWEYTARDGHLMNRDLKYSGSNFLVTVGWFWKNSGDRFVFLPERFWNGKVITKNRAKPQPVGNKKPNGLKIHDMSGNVWEWCHDWFGEYSKTPVINPLGPKTGHYKAVRGGSWFFGKHFCRVSSRFYADPFYHDFQTGFRVARTVHR